MAAGLGFKDFVTGEVLTAADVDGYLMQGVWVFASAAARDAAVTSPQEGNFAYLKDTNVTTYYTGSAWANLDTTGMTNPMTTTGDTIYSSSGSTPARLGIGSTGNVLTVAGGVPTWAAPAGGGGMTLLSTTNLTGASTTVSSISGSYKNLQINMKDFYPSGEVAILVRFNSDTSSGNYRSLLMRGKEGTAGSDIMEDNNSGFRLLGYNVDDADQNNFTSIVIPDYANATTTKVISANGSGREFNSGYFCSYLSGLYLASPAAITSITFGLSSGTWSGGSVEIYGVN